MKHNVLLSLVGLVSIVPVAATSFCAPAQESPVARVAAKAARPVQGTILSGAAAKGLFRQCSRATPQADGWWKVYNRDVQDLEAALPHFWNNRKTKPKLPLEKYYRQYAGYTHKGRKVIYLNAFNFSEAGPRWKTEPVVVCDGGDWFFGVEYDVKTHTFHNLSFNGLA